MSVHEHLHVSSVFRSKQVSAPEHLPAGGVWQNAEVPALPRQVYLMCGSWNLLLRFHYAAHYPVSHLKKQNKTTTVQALIFDTQHNMLKPFFTFIRQRKWAHDHVHQVISCPAERNQRMVHNRAYQIISCSSSCNSLMRTVLLLTSYIHWQQLSSFLIQVSWIYHLSHPLNQPWSGYNHYFYYNVDVNGNQTNSDTSWPENEEAVQCLLSAYFIFLSFQYLY